MRKFLLGLLLITGLLSASIAFAANPMQNLAGVGAKDTPTQYQIQIDYDGRTDGQPVYFGYALRGALTSEDAWIVYHFTYDGDNQLLTRKTAYGIWDDRASLSYQ